MIACPVTPPSYDVTGPHLWKIAIVCPGFMVVLKCKTPFSCACHWLFADYDL